MCVVCACEIWLLKCLGTLQKIYSLTGCDGRSWTNGCPPSGKMLSYVCERGGCEMSLDTLQKICSPTGRGGRVEKKGRPTKNGAYVSYTRVERKGRPPSGKMLFCKCI